MLAQGHEPYFSRPPRSSSKSPNTLKFVPHGGSVRITTGSSGENVELCVSDDGPGISDEDLDHVFERFYRGQRVRTGGSGIGLAVVAALVRAHDGEVAVTRNGDDGALFHIQLPKSRDGASISGDSGQTNAFH